MNKTILAAFALSLVVLPLAGSAYAQSCTVGALCKTSSTASPEDPTPVVCFFTATDFKGLRFCESGQRSVFTVPAKWRDSIKSITVGTGTEVKLCPEFTLKGECNVFGRDIDKLQPGLFDQVYSYELDKT